MSEAVLTSSSSMRGFSVSALELLNIWLLLLFLERLSRPKGSSSESRLRGKV
jgi:hypothetical protein